MTTRRQALEQLFERFTYEANMADRHAEQAEILKRDANAADWKATARAYRNAASIILAFKPRKDNP